MKDSGAYTMLFIVFGIWLLVLTVIVGRIVDRYRRLTGGIKKKKLIELLEGISGELTKQKTSVLQLEEAIEKLHAEEEGHLQKIGFIRFNPFIDTGGDQSFCLSVLDRHDNGIVISSLHSRDQTRLYAKKIRSGKSEGQELSREEKEAVKRAQATT